MKLLHIEVNLRSWMKFWICIDHKNTMIVDLSHSSYNDIGRIITIGLFGKWIIIYQLMNKRWKLQIGSAI